MNALGLLEAGRVHLDKVGGKVLGTGGRSGVVKKLHGESRLHLSHGHGLVVDLAGLGKLIGGFTHNLQCVLGKLAHLGAEILVCDHVRDLPVEHGNVLGQNVVYAAGDKAHGSALYDVKVGHNEGGSAHGGRLLLAVDDSRADVGGEAVGRCKRGYRNKGDAQLICRITAEVHDGARTVGDDDLGVIELLHHVLDERILSPQTLSLKHYLLIGGDMLALGELINDRVVHNGTLLARKADIGHVLFKVVDSAVLDDDHLRFKLVVTAALAQAGVFGTIHYHSNLPHISTVSNLP